MPDDTGGPAAWTKASCPGLSPAVCPPRAICGTSASSALVRSDCSCGLVAPGVGGGRLKLVGIASGARVVTVNSSGASWMKPKVRPNFSPLQLISGAAATARTITRATCREVVSISDFLTADQSAPQAPLARGPGAVRARQQAVDHQCGNAADDRRVSQVEDVPRPTADMGMDKVDHCAEAQPVDDIGQRAADNGTERDRNHPRLGAAQPHDQRDDDRKRDRGEQ